MTKFNMKLMEDIVPFLFPCPECEGATFHQVYKQPAGLGLKIPFTNTALMSTHKGYHVVCMTCTIINGQVKQDSIDKLENRLLPKAIYKTYPEIKQYYTPGFIDANRKTLLKGLDEDTIQCFKDWTKKYRLET